MKHFLLAALLFLGVFVGSSAAQVISSAPVVRATGSDPTGNACTIASPVLAFHGKTYNCVSNIYAPSDTGGVIDATATVSGKAKLGQLPTSTYAGLPTCAAGNKGQLVDVTDTTPGVYKCDGAGTWVIQGGSDATKLPLAGGTLTGPVTSTSTYTGAVLDKGGAVYTTAAYSVPADGTTDARSSLNTLLNTTMSAGGEIYFTAGTYSVQSALTIPANVRVKFAPGAMLKPANGCTITILGEIVPTNFQIFTNILSGQGAVAFSTSGKINKYNLAWWGPDATESTDAQPAIQAAINQVPSYSELTAPPHSRFLINSTVTFSNVDGIFLVAEGAYGVNGNAGGWSGFKWNGAAGGTMLSLDRARHCRVVGWTFVTQGASNAADKAIDIDGYAVAQISTENWIMENLIYGNTRATFKGISISETASNNNEFMRLIHNTLVGNSRNGYGIYLGGSSNAHGHTLQNNSLYSFNYGLWEAGGSFTSLGVNNAGDNNVDIWIDDEAYPVVIHGWDSENSAKFAFLNGSNAPIAIKHCRIASPGTNGQGIIQFGSSAQWIEVSDNDMNAVVTASYVYDATLAQNLQLRSSGNRFPSLALASIFYSFTGGSSRYTTEGGEVGKYFWLSAGSLGNDQGKWATVAQSTGAFSVGQSLANPAWLVDTSTASSATGLSLTSAAAGGGTALAVTSSGSNESLTLTPKGTGSFVIPSAVTTGSGSTAGVNLTFNSLTTGNGLDASSSSVSGGNVVKIAATGTAAASNTKTALNVATSGANSTSAMTTYGGRFSNTSTGTTSSNVALYATASGGATGNYAGIFDAGFVGIGQTVPLAALHIKSANVGSRGQLSIEDTSFAQITFYKGPVTGTDLGASIYYENGSGGQFHILAKDTSGGFTGKTFINENGGNVSVGNTLASAKLHVTGTTEQQRLAYDASNYISFTVGSAGSTTITATGTTPTISIANPIINSGAPQTLTGSGAVNLTTYSTLLDTTSTGTDTLAAGSEGQYKFIRCKTYGVNGVVTVTNLQGGTTITFTGAGQFVLLFYQDAKWHIIVNSGTTVA